MHIGQWGAGKKLWEAALSAQAAAFGRGAGDTDSFPVLQCPPLPLLLLLLLLLLLALSCQQRSNPGYQQHKAWRLPRPLIHPQPFHLEVNMSTMRSHPIMHLNVDGA